MNISSSSLPPLALIAGPTASGKSALALALAEHGNGIVINADSAQVYRDLRLVSARPTAADEARVPHKLYGYRDASEPCSAADWAADARAAIEQGWAEDRLPILVGGTGLYLRVLLEGIAPIPPIDPLIRESVRAASTADNFGALRAEDPEAAGRIRPNDSSRIARALEVLRSTGRTLSAWQQLRTGGLGSSVRLMPLVLLPPRPWLHERCDRRFEAIMAEAGVEEVRRLLARNLDPSLPAMRAIGVAGIAAMLAGRLSPELAMAAGQAATRQYAKRQYTWFSRQPPPEWPRLAEPADSLDDKVWMEFFAFR